MLCCAGRSANVSEMLEPRLTKRVGLLMDGAMGRGKEGSNNELGESAYISRASHSLSLTMHAHTLRPTRLPTLYACTPIRPHTLVHARPCTHVDTVTTHSIL